MSRSVILISPSCSNPSSPWFSPGRSRKLEQVINLFSSLDYTIKFHNTAPVKSQSFDGGVNIVSCCSKSFWLIRFLELFASGFVYGFKWKFSRIKSTKLLFWMYNSRLAEFIYFLPFYLLNSQHAKLCIQFEDLPSARESKSGLRGLIDRQSTKLLLSIATCATCVSSNVKESLFTLYHYPQKKILIFPPLADLDYLDQLQRRNHPFTSSTINIMYAGGYDMEKGVSTLLEAFCRINDSKYILNLFGPAPIDLKNDYLNCPNILFHGLVSNQHLYHAYSTSDVIVNPHLVIKNASHIFPFKFVEILASGALPLATMMPGIEDLRVPDDCIFTDSNDLYIKLINSRSIYCQNEHRLSNCTNDIRENYSPLTFIQKFSSFLYYLGYIS